MPHTREYALRLLSRLDRGRVPCELLPIAPGDEVDLSRELVLTVSETKHTVPSLGILIWERRKKLKPEFADLSGEEIRDIRLSGTEVSELLPHIAGCIENCNRMGELAVEELRRHFAGEPAIYRISRDMLDRIA